MILQETYKIFTRPYAKIVLLVMAVLMLIFSAAFAFEGQEYYDSLLNTFGKGVSFEGKLLNGNLFAFQLFHALWLLVALMVVFVTGGMISEEKSAGTLRMVLSRKISKTGFFTARFAAAKVFAFIVVVFMAAISLGFGLAVFGSGELLAFDNGKFTVLTANQALLSFALAYVFYFLMLLTVISISMFFSVLFNSSIKAILVTVSVIVVFYFISTLELPLFDGVKPFLFTSYFSSWAQFFTTPVNWMKLTFDAIVLLVHILVFYTASVMIFGKQEVLD